MLASFGFLLASLLSLPAHARVGVTIRLTEPPEGIDGADVLLATPGQEAQSVALADDGSPPDTVAGDGTWSGTAFVADGDLSVSLRLGDRTLPGGTVSWTADVAYRDLLLRVDDGALVAEAASSGQPGAYIGGASAPSPMSAGDAFGRPALGSAATTKTKAPAASVSAGDGVGPGLLLYGAGGLLLVGLALGWALLPSLREGGQNVAFDRIPEPPFLGTGTPSLSDGLTVWVVPPAQHDALAVQLCRTLAHHHRVLLVAPPSLSLPPTPGGRIFIAHGRGPDDVGDAAEQLDEQGADPLAVVVATTTESLARRFPRALPPGVGGILLVGAEINTALPVYHCEQSDGGGWRLQGPAGSVALSEVDGELVAG